MPLTLNEISFDVISVLFFAIDVDYQFYSLFDPRDVIPFFEFKLFTLTAGAERAIMARSMVMELTVISVLIFNFSFDIKL